jgi:hypothetical protein
MKIIALITLGLVIIFIKFLMPDVFLALSNTILMFFRFLQIVLSVAGQPAMQTSVLLPINW